MSQSVKTSASIATSPTTSTFCCYIFSSHLLTSPHHWNIMEYLWLDTWWHESTSKLPHLRPKGPSVPSKLVQVPWHMKSSDGSKSLASQCISMQHVQTLLMEYSWNSVYVLDKGHSLQKFLNRFKGFEMFPHCPVRLFAGISFDLAFSCNQKVSARIA